MGVTATIFKRIGITTTSIQVGKRIGIYHKTITVIVSKVDTIMQVISMLALIISG
jgi:hypothetical protein